MSIYIKFRSLKRLLGGQVVGVDHKHFTVVNVRNLQNGKSITHQAKVDRNIAHELIETDNSGFVRSRAQERYPWYYMHLRNRVRMLR